MTPRSGLLCAVPSWRDAESPKQPRAPLPAATPSGDAPGTAPVPTRGTGPGTHHGAVFRLRLPGPLAFAPAAVSAAPGWHSRAPSAGDPVGDRGSGLAGRPRGPWELQPTLASVRDLCRRLPFPLCPGRSSPAFLPCSPLTLRSLWPTELGGPSLIPLSLGGRDRPELEARPSDQLSQARSSCFGRAPRSTHVIPPSAQQPAHCPAAPITPVSLPSPLALLPVAFLTCLGFCSGSGFQPAKGTRGE